MQEFDVEEDSITGINVTPLVDITLVLLIIFMVTARFISEQPNIGVKLPNTTQGGNNSVDDNNVFLSISSQNQLYLNDQKLNRNELVGRIKKLIAEKPNLNLVLRADQDVSHGEVMAVLDAVRSQGVSQFGIAVEPRKE